MEIKITYLCAIAYFIAFFIACLLVPLSIKFANRIGAIDIPKDDRRVHKKPIPRIGGVAIFIGINIAILLIMLAGAFHTASYNHLKGTVTLSINTGFFAEEQVVQVIGTLIGSAIIFICGFIDDLKNLSPRVKLIGQIIAATFVFFMGVRIEFVTIFFSEITHFSTIVCYFVTILWIVAITNTINLIDGLDGLASGIVGIAALCIAYIGYIFGYYEGALPMLAIAGGALGFLPYNFYPAKTFMGDCGSQYLGFMIASFSIIGSVKSATVVAILIPALALLLPILDTILAILRRIINKKPIMEADKEHLHHRLLRAGMGQRRTVLCLYGICAVMGVAAVLLSRSLYIETIGLFFIAIMFIYVVLTGSNEKKPRLSSNDKK